MHLFVVQDSFLKDPKPNTMLKAICTCLFLLATCCLFSQPIDDEYFYGFKAGANYYSIDDIATTIIPPVFSTATYSTKTTPRLGFVGGVYFYHRFPDMKN